MADAFAIRALTGPQIREVYARRLIEDFPPDERKPLHLIERALSRGKYACHGCFIGDRMAAYAFFAMLEKNALVDYFSVDKSLRDHGLGSRFLQALIDGPLGELDCALLEVEEPDIAPDPNERELRRRRLRFYLNNGLKDTGVRVTVYHVNYRVLALPVGRVPLGEDALSTFLSIYRAMPPERVYAEKMQIEGTVAT